MSIKNQAKEFDVIVAGHICLDIIPRFEDSGVREIGKAFVPGSLINVGAATLSTGGPVSNTGIGLKIIGNKVSFIARIGDDEIGALVLKYLGNSGNVKGIVVSKNESTSYTVVLAMPGIDRIFLHNPGTNDTFKPGDISYDLVKKARIFHLGYPPLMKNMHDHSGKYLVEIYKNAKKTGVTTSIDMSIPDASSPSGQVDWKSILEKLLPYVDISLPSIEEMFFMLEKEEYLNLRQANVGKDLIGFISPRVYSRIAAQMLRMGTKIAVLKTGHRGYYIRTADEAALGKMGIAPPKDLANWANRELWCPAFKVDKIASATGSGDSSIAGFLSAYLRGLSIEDTLKFSNCYGYQNLHALDALSGIKTWKETASLLKQDLEMIDPEIGSDGWTYDGKFKLWKGPEDGKPVK